MGVVAVVVAVDVVAVAIVFDILANVGNAALHGFCPVCGPRLRSGAPDPGHVARPEGAVPTRVQHQRSQVIRTRHWQGMVSWTPATVATPEHLPC